MQADGGDVVPFMSPGMSFSPLLTARMEAFRQQGHLCGGEAGLGEMEGGLGDRGLWCALRHAALPASLPAHLLGAD